MQTPGDSFIGRAALRTRPFGQYTLRALFVAVFGCALGAWLLHATINEGKRQAAAIRAMRGQYVRIDFEPGSPWWARWLEPYIGEHAFDTVYKLDLDAEKAREHASDIFQLLADIRGPKEITASHCRLYDEDLKELYAKRSLAVVRLDATNIGDRGLRFLRCLPGLTELTCEWTAVTDAGALNDLPNMYRLRTLSLGATYVTDAGLSGLSALALERVYLDYTPITDEGISYVQGWRRSVRLLSLNGTKVSDEAMASIGQFRLLQSLDLKHTKVGDEGIRHIAGLNKLRRLVLYGTRCSDESIAYILQLSNLEELDIGKTNITVDGCIRLRELKSFSNLYIQNCDYSDSEIKRIKEALPRCEVSEGAAPSNYPN